MMGLFSTTSHHNNNHAESEDREDFATQHRLPTLSMRSKHGRKHRTEASTPTPSKKDNTQHNHGRFSASFMPSSSRSGGMTSPASSPALLSKATKSASTSQCLTPEQECDDLELVEEGEVCEFGSGDLSKALSSGRRSRLKRWFTKSREEVPAHQDANKGAALGNNRTPAAASVVLASNHGALLANLGSRKRRQGHRRSRSALVGSREADAYYQEFLSWERAKQLQGPNIEAPPLPCPPPLPAKQSSLRSAPARRGSSCSTSSSASPPPLPPFPSHVNLPSLGSSSSLSRRSSSLSHFGEYFDEENDMRRSQVIVSTSRRPSV